ncbi:MAG: ABC transporter permease [Acholeplasmatales bacterium]|jgi:ABC-type transport system involved in multi-copper enzyme maturation permease subunit|nr:ABC transporter permease [Acholeplasmatales bacterium]
MSSLLRLEFRRYFKDKGLLITLIVSTAVTIFMCLLLSQVNNSFGENNHLFTPVSIFSYSFSTQNYVTYSIFINGLIILIKDYNQGTMRNKIVTGYSRAKVYYSSYIVFLAFGVGITFICGFLGFGISTAILGASSINASDFLLTFAFGLLWMVFLYTFFYFLATTFKNIGAPLGIGIGCLVMFLVIDLIVSILQMSTNFSQTLIDIIYAIPFLQMNKHSSLLSSTYLNPSGNMFETKEIITIIISNVILIGGFLGLGHLSFTNSDLK